MLRWIAGLPGRILPRLLLVNLLVLLVPWAGLEFARLHERQLLVSLERDMRNQAVLAREIVEDRLAYGDALGSSRTLAILVDAARSTRTRTRVLGPRGAVVLDSHAMGPPEGPEPPPPVLVPADVYAIGGDVRRAATSSAHDLRWPAVEDRSEVRDALRGRPSASTRLRDRHPSVILFVTEPIRSRGAIVGAIYVTRSTQPVLEELYKIRSGLTKVMAIATFLTALLSLVLALSISRPLARLARAARKIAAGDRDVVVPVAGSGEIRDVAAALATMTTTLDQRLRYISDFAADVAHEFKSPLTAIRGAAELLGEGAADDPVARERFLRNILLDAERLDRLVTRLLELSRIDASRTPMKTVDVAGVIDRVVERTITAEQPIRVHAERPIPSIAGREEDLERALLNLVENATRFSPPGEPIDIEVEKLDRVLRIAVRDRGVGIPPEHRAKIFERFFTTDAERRGTGLGLSIVSSVAAAHGGRAYLDPTSESGARFVLEIPRARVAR
jgi:two-component system sensor histidine kinase ChvG